ncbi:katanin p60 ATPase-containing subunit A-like 2 [Simochromis diagramma]|uniref:katanin p60 ATPase-containing subunit A-like 2 n=1 Tax=Simochromis diagramma TaxID=43689 RepID=UPI001A7E7F93|nr:katanin p60 ATPase-containing subunit A-like 2 [Simochromis diagramma]
MCAGANFWLMSSTCITHSLLCVCVCVYAFPKDIYLHSPNVRWEDIIGLEDAKRLVKEAVVYPIKYPQLFTGILSPWKGLLLYGPPGKDSSVDVPLLLSTKALFTAFRGEHEGSRRIKTELLVQMVESYLFTSLPSHDISLAASSQLHRRR